MAATTYDIPDTVKTIGVRSFSNNSKVKTINIPASVTNIHEAAFAHCVGLTDINVAEGNNNYVSANGILFSKNRTTLVAYPEGKDGKSYIVPASVTTIGASAFRENAKLEEINLPKLATTIKTNAFRDCSKLKEIELPTGITKLEGYTFSGCGALENVKFNGDTITEIGEEAFSKCISLERMVIPSGRSKVNGQPDTETKLARRAFSGCVELKKLILHSTVTTIGESAFENCSKIIIYGDKGSKAEEYATAAQRTFRVYGDINGDNIFSGTDAQQLNEYILGVETRVFNEEQLERADVMAFGEVSGTDLLRLKWKLISKD